MVIYAPRQDATRNQTALQTNKLFLTGKASKFFRLGNKPNAARWHVFQVKLRALGAFSCLQRHWCNDAEFQVHPAPPLSLKSRWQVKILAFSSVEFRKTARSSFFNPTNKKNSAIALNLQKNMHEIQPSLGFQHLRGSVAHPRALAGKIQTSSWSRVINLRPLLACNSGQYFTFPASDIWSETIHISARKETLTRTPKKIRPPQKLANSLWARFKHLLEVVG